MKLAEKATNEALKCKGETKEKDAQITSLNRQLEEKKKQLGVASNKINKLTNNIMSDLTKQLEGKIKEIEMLKEMLRSSKIELSGKEKEIKRLKSKKSFTQNRIKKIEKQMEFSEENKSPDRSITKSKSFTKIKYRSNRKKS